VCFQILLAWNGQELLNEGVSFRVAGMASVWACMAGVASQPFSFFFFDCVFSLLLWGGWSDVFFC
jgi:hypothetical protein